MLGYAQENNDLYVFFENDEIERLGVEKIKGTYFNSTDPSVTATLEVIINNKMWDRIKKSLIRNEAGSITKVVLEMKTEIYQRFRERRKYEYHEGWCHFCLKDSTRKMAPMDIFNYLQLKTWEAHIPKPEER